MSAGKVVSFSMPGGEISSCSRGRPVDLAHLSRQTLGDRDLEQEVLDLFVQHAISVRDQIRTVSRRERLFLVHGLKGSARGVGAFPIAECLAQIEKESDDAAGIDRLSILIDEVRDFIASISR